MTSRVPPCPSEIFLDLEDGQNIWLLSKICRSQGVLIQYSICLYEKSVHLAPSHNYKIKYRNVFEQNCHVVYFELTGWQQIQNILSSCKFCINCHPGKFKIYNYMTIQQITRIRLGICLKHKYV